MDIQTLSIKEIKNLIKEEPTDALIEAIKLDERKGVQNIFKALFT